MIAGPGWTPLNSSMATAKVALTVARIASNYARGLIDSLTGGGVVIRPEGGWNQLKLRLLKDLERDGRVLPIQLRVALQGLRQDLADRLTPWAYRHAGGLRGLEALMIRAYIGDVTKVKSEQIQILRALAKLIDDKDKQKPKARTMEELLPFVVDAAASDQKPRVSGASARSREANTYGRAWCLGQRNREIVRETLLETGEAAWTLNHGYLCRAVLEARRGAEWWQLLMADSEKVWEDSGNHKSNLLPVRYQVVFLARWLAGSFEYGVHAAYARASLVRIIPLIIWLIVLGGLGYGLVELQRQSSEREARLTSRIAAQSYLRGTMPVDPASRQQALWDLALEPSKEVRRMYLEEALSTRDLADRLGDNVDYATQAVVGLDRDLRPKVINDIVMPKVLDDSADPSIRSVAARVGQCLNAADASPEFNQRMLSLLRQRPTSKYLIDHKMYYARALGWSIDPSFQSDLCVAMETLWREMEDKQVRGAKSSLELAFEQIVNRLDGPTSRKRARRFSPPPPRTRLPHRHPHTPRFQTLRLLRHPVPRRNGWGSPSWIFNRRRCVTP